MTPLPLAALLCLTLPLAALAAPVGMTETAYRAESADIAATQKKALEYCAFLTENTREICIAEADGKQSVARAELEAAYRPGANRTRAASVAAADANFAVDMKRCDGRSRSEKTACFDLVRSTRRTAQADADMALGNSIPTASEIKRAARIRGNRIDAPK